MAVTKQAKQANRPKSSRENEAMNAEQKAEILEDNGYHYEESSYKSTKHRWYRRGIMIVAAASYASATKKAYEDYLDRQRDKHLGEQRHMTEAEIVAEAQQAPLAPATDAVEESGLLIIDHDGTEHKTTVDAFVQAANEYEQSLTVPQPLAEKNAKIARLQAALEHERMNSAELETSVKELTAELAAAKKVIQGFADEPLPLINAIFWQQTAKTFLQTPAAPQAPTPAVTLTVDEEFPNHDADDFTKADLEFFARQPHPEKFWYYQELSERQKAAIAERRKQLESPVAQDNGLTQAEIDYIKADAPDKGR